MTKRDAFLLLGLLGLCAGLSAQFGWPWAAIAAGFVLFAFGLLEDGGEK